MPKKITERACVNKLIKNLKRNSPDIYTFIDRDAGAMRHTSSGWDFLLVRGLYVCFVEAKIGAGKLTDWQELTRDEIKLAGGSYHVLRFSADGRLFSIDGGATRAVDNVTTGHFFFGEK